MKNFLSSDSFYKLIKIIGDFLVNASEQVVKQWLGTVIGQRFFKWLTDILITRFYDSIIEPLMRVGVVRVGYYYDLKDAENKIKKLKKAEASNDLEEYLRTLDDVFGTRKL